MADEFQIKIDTTFNSKLRDIGFKLYHTFISSIKEGKPPMDMNVMKPEMKAPHAPLAKMAV